jgi:TolB protein
LNSTWRLILIWAMLMQGWPVLVHAQAEEPDQEFVVISKAPRQVPVAVPDFLPKYPGHASRELSVKLAQILREDLDASGLFQVIPMELYLQALPLAEGGEDFNAWGMIGAEACARGIFDQSSEGSFQIELRFYDVTGKRGCFETRIAFVSDRTGRKEIYIMDSDSENIQPVTKNKTLNLSPEWLDSRSLLYTSYRKVLPQLYIARIGEGIERQITDKTRFNLGAAVSPGKDKIAVAMENMAGNIDIYMMNTDGSDIRRVTTSDAIDLSPAWSPDSRFLAFVSDRTGSPQIYLLNLLAGSESSRNRPVRLTQEGGYNTSPAWSPDGKRIAFVARIEGQFDLFMINLDKEGRNTITRLTTTPFSEEDPGWSPDGRMLVYCSNQRGNYDVYTISIFSGKTRRLTDWDAYDGAPAWSPGLRPEGL